MARGKKCTCTASRWDDSCPIHDTRREWADAYDDADDDSQASGGRGESLNITIDLSDENAVRRGMALGYLRREDLEDEDDDGADDGDDGPAPASDESTKPRRGFFGDREADAA